MHFLREQYYGGPIYMERGCPANRGTWLEGLRHSLPLHPTNLTGTVRGLRELPFERPLSTTNTTADQGNFFPSYFSFLHRHGPVLFLRLVYYIVLLRMTKCSWVRRRKKYRKIKIFWSNVMQRFRCLKWLVIDTL